MKHTNQHKEADSSCFSRIFKKSPNDVIKAMMEMNIRDAKSIYELCKNSKCLDSQEVMDWQDELNTISVKYG